MKFSRRIQRSLLPIIAILATAFAKQPQSKHVGGAEQSLPHILVATPVFTEFPNPYRIKPDKSGTTYILSRVDNSIGIFNVRHELVRRIGHVGMGPVEFQDPCDFAIDKQGLLYVADYGNNRIQVVNQSGTQVREFAFHRPASIGVLADGRIIVAGSEKGHLMDVFSATGKYLSSIGTPVDTGVQRADANAVLNSGSIYVEESGRIYYLFMNLLKPGFRIYAADGNLLQHVDVYDPSMSAVIQRAEQSLRDRLAKNKLGATATMKSLCIDSKTGNIWVAPAGMSIIVLNRKFQKISEFTAQDASSGSPVGIFDMVDAGDFLYARGLSSAGVAGCYVVKRPDLR